MALEFEHEYEFSPIIVWDALVDADLVSGWLAEATITPEVGGEYVLRWLHRIGLPATAGRIVVMDRPARLEVDTSNLGRLAFGLEEFGGGSRGSSTRLRVRIDAAVESAFAARMTADWLTNLDQLEDLLRGHPVDWGTWDRDRRDSWTQHLDEARHTTGSR